MTLPPELQVQEQGKAERVAIGSRSVIPDCTGTPAHMLDNSTEADQPWRLHVCTSESTRPRWHATSLKRWHARWRLSHHGQAATAWIKCTAVARSPLNGANSSHCIAHLPHAATARASRPQGLLTSTGTPWLHQPPPLRSVPGVMRPAGDAGTTPEGAHTSTRAHLHPRTPRTPRIAPRAQAPSGGAPSGGAPCRV